MAAQSQIITWSQTVETIGISSTFPLTTTTRIPKGNHFRWDTISFWERVSTYCQWVERSYFSLLRAGMHWSSRYALWWIYLNPCWDLSCWINQERAHRWHHDHSQIFCPKPVWHASPHLLCSCALASTGCLLPWILPQTQCWGTHLVVLTASYACHRCVHHTLHNSSEL